MRMDTSVRAAKALSDPSRMRITAALMHKKELCVCQLTELMDLAMSTVSRHISLLQSAHLVESRKEGRWIFYRLSENFSPVLKEWLKKDVLDTPEAAEDRKKLSEMISCVPADICAGQGRKDNGKEG